MAAIDAEFLQHHPHGRRALTDAMRAGEQDGVRQAALLRPAKPLFCKFSMP